MRTQPLTSWRALASIFGIAAITSCVAADKTFRAGAAISDISPTNYPVLVNAMFTERTATQTVDRLEARALVLDDGSTRIVLTVVDSCMLPRDLLDRAKNIASKSTGIPAAHMMISSTHTHSAPSAMGCLGSRVDTNYAALLPPKIAAALIAANAKLQPAKIGWTVVNDWDHTFNRRWIRRPDRMLEDPFGQRSVRAHMHPGYQSPDATGPSGPVDPALSIIAVQTPDGHPFALLANYSQHYYGSPLVSSDYYGRFRTHLAKLLPGVTDSFVGIMSQGTSGDQMWMDYGAPQKEIGYDAYAREIAERVREACSQIQFQDWVPLGIAQRAMQLRYRAPSPERLEWARKVAAGLGDRIPQQLPEVYALEAIYLHDRPESELVLQAIRIGDLGIAAIPNEVYALTGLKLKAQSPFPTTINVELANGAEGYIPTPEQHKLGGYTTWPARTAGLEVMAEPKITEGLLSLLEQVSGKPRRKPNVENGPYAEAILASKPLAYWRFEEMSMNKARDSSPNHHDATYENGVALYLPGPGSGEGVSPLPELIPSNFSGPNAINRAVHFAGGRVRSEISLGTTYSVEMWFWNGLDNSARPVTGYLFSNAVDYLIIDGTGFGTAGKLRFENRDASSHSVVGRTEVQMREWHHLVFTRDERRIKIYLDGREEISGQTIPRPVGEILIGGNARKTNNFEGKLDEVAIYDRALRPDEVAAHHKAAGLQHTP
jgi:hypothetical protein